MILHEFIEKYFDVFSYKLACSLVLGRHSAESLLCDFTQNWKLQQQAFESPHQVCSSSNLTAGASATNADL